MNNTTNTHWEPVNTFWVSRERFLLQKAIHDAIKTDPESSKKNTESVYAAIFEILSRTKPQKESNATSIMDIYHIPENLSDDLTDDDLYDILYWILCRPERFENGDPKNITYDGLEKLKYILNRSAEHTIQMMEEVATNHQKWYSDSTQWKIKNRWNPNSDTPQKFKYNRLWIWYFKNTFWDLVEIEFNPQENIYKINFNLDKRENYIKIIRKLLSSKNSFANKQRNWLFIKNFLTFSDLERYPAYIGRRTHFEQIIKEIFYPFLKLKGPINESPNFEQESPNFEQESLNSEQETSSPEQKCSKNFNISISKTTQNKKSKRNLTWKFIFCTKSLEAIINKIFRDPKYKSPKDLKDMFRWSIIMKNHEDLVLMMHYFIKYFIQNPEHKFVHSIFNEDTNERENEEKWIVPENGRLRDLDLKDKWIFITTNEKRKEHLKSLPEWKKPEDWTNPRDYTDENLDWIATKYLRKKAIQEKTDSNNTNSENYIDTKLNIPIQIRGNLTSIELKFILNENVITNDKWLESHKRMRFKEDILKRIRNEKFIFASEIKRKIKALLDDDKQLKKEITSQINRMYKNNIKTVWKESTFKTPLEDYLFNLIIKNLETKNKNKNKKNNIPWYVYFDKELLNSHKNQWVSPNRNTVWWILFDTKKEKENKEQLMIIKIIGNAKELEKSNDNSDSRINKMISDLKTALENNDFNRIETIYKRITRRIKSKNLIDEIEKYEGSNSIKEEKKNKISNLKDNLKHALNRNNLENIKKYYMALQRECIDWIIEDKNN